MDRINVLINGVNYTSIGIYVDNNDGICHYVPDTDEPLEWLDFFERQEPIILLWTLSYLHSEFPGCIDVFGKIVKLIIESNEQRLSLFLQKYCWQNILGDMFIDFIFGEYSEYGNNKEHPTMKIIDEFIKYDEFEFREHVFIDSVRYLEFVGELNIIRMEIIKILQQEVSKI
jgi:hypothetical protein